MKEIEVNGVKVILHPVEELKEHNVAYYPIPWKNIEKAIKYGDWGWANSHWSLGNFLKVAGHGYGWDHGQIDPAVPEGWYWQYRLEHGEFPAACWTYEPRPDGKGEIFGRPLFYADLWEEWRQNVLAVLEKELESEWNTRSA